MKYLQQISIIFVVTVCAEALHYLAPIPVPACVYGLVLMLLALHFHIIPLESVRETSRFLIEIMPLMFIPPAVGLIASMKDLKDFIVPLLITIVLTTFLVVGVTGQVAQQIIRYEKLGRRRKKYAASRIK